MVDALLSTVLTKLVDLISEEVGLLSNAKEGLSKLQSELQAIRATFKDADGLPCFFVEGLKDWLQKLKEAAYDAEDVIDEYRARIALNEDRRAARKKKVSGLLTDLPLFLNKHVNLRHKLGKEIKAINERLTQISKERQRYNLDAFNSDVVAKKKEEVNTNRETNFNIEKKDIVGRESDNEALIEELMLDEETNDSVSILSIVGIGGVGKTTLAKMVFNDERIKKHFEGSMWWVFVSQETSAKDVNRKILEAVRKEGSNVSELNTMCELLNPILSKKKFLLVLDDVWDVDWWEQLKALLRKGARGSRILITTRIADISHDLRAVYMHELEHLTFEESWDLFLQKALRDGETEEVLEKLNLKDIAHDIVNKCGGLPLVVQTVGSVMHSKARDRENWKFICDSKVWDWKLSSSSSQSSSLLPGIILSYDHLPSILRPYFAFFSLLRKGEVMTLWGVLRSAMAHGFPGIRAPGIANGTDMEALAAQHITDLLGRCLLQKHEPEPPETEPDLSMHDIIHDLATYVAGREYCRDRTSIDEHTRHLGISDSLISLDEIGLHSTKSLRTLACYGGLSESPLDRDFKHLKRLRMLALENSKLTKLPDSIGDLILLKFLSLNKSNIEELPASIGRLYNLQSFDLSESKIKRLPKEIGDLRNLRYFVLEDTPELQFVPEGLGNLSCLRELTKFVICDGNGTDVGGANIRELKNLNKLRGKLAIHNLERVREKNDARNAELQEKHFVNELELAFGKTIVHELSTEEGIRDVAEAHESLFEELLLPPNLEHLTVTQYCGRSFPTTWCSHDSQMHLKFLKLLSCPCISMLPNSSTLTKLHLFECHHLRELPSFPCLSQLVIDQCNEFNQVPIFSNVVTMELKSLVNLEEWQPWVEGHAMASLTTLKVSNCPKLRRLPYLPALKELHVYQCSALCTIQEAQGDVKPEMSVLTDLVVHDCEELFELPGVPFLKTLTLKGCPKIKDIPLLKELEKLQVKYCENWKGSVLERENDLMPCLREIWINTCPMLKRLPHAPALESIQVFYCEALNALWHEKEPPIQLGELLISYCPELGFSLDGLLPLTKLQTLIFSWSPEWAQARPSHLACLQRLTTLGLDGLPANNLLPEWLWHLSSLKTLALYDINEPRSFQGKWQNLKQLERLGIWRCPELITLDMLFTEAEKQDEKAEHKQESPLPIPPKLEHLLIIDCPKLESLPNGLQRLVNLRGLGLVSLTKLTSLPEGITHLHQLEELEIVDCPKLSSLPVDLKHRPQCRIFIRGCDALEEGRGA